MKIIHCADLHLDSRLSANLDKEKRRERKAELLDTFCRMITYAREQEVAAIILAGDLFDTKKVSVSARNTVYGAMSQNPRITFYYLRGNHDTDSFLNELEEIPANLKLFESKWTAYTTGELCVTGAELSRENPNAVFDSLLLDTAKINIVVLHGQEGEEINLSALRNKGIDYLALGHIHAYKRSRLDARGVCCYPGCLEGRGFDECGSHGFVLLDIDTKQHTCTDTFVPFAYRELYTVETDISGCMTTLDITAKAEETLHQLEISAGSLVKLVLTGAVDVECEKDLKLLQKQFSARFYFLKIQDDSRFAVDYSSFLHDESLKGEFVRMVMASAEDEETKAAVIRLGIRALEGEELD